ncbi:hypothetical protein AYI70_g10943 [Smittium culicis]|uniref:Uncharacterized protein n=1 Tax=Smittium culicis TaxID=133412 RepID=A0A1R1X441_9FUNG|nr:hypothetical protein AYI70_g10943 [Smittium culicis]
MNLLKGKKIDKTNVDTTKNKSFMVFGEEAEDPGGDVLGGERVAVVAELARYQQRRNEDLVRGGGAAHEVFGEALLQAITNGLISGLWMYPPVGDVLPPPSLPVPLRFGLSARPIACCRVFWRCARAIARQVPATLAVPRLFATESAAGVAV